MDKRELIERCRENDVKFVRLQFTELYGQLKNISIPAEELEKALDNELMFDGSSIRGFKRIEKSDMYFHPGPGDLPGAALGRARVGQDGAHHLRRRRSGRHAVRGRPARAAEEGARRRQGRGLRDVGRARGGVLPLQARRGEPADARPARPRLVLRRLPGRPRRGHAPRHRGRADEPRLQPRGLAPRGRDRPARDRLPPRRRAQLRRQPDHVPLGRQARRGAQRHPRDVHAEAAVRRERLGHAHQPVALARRARTRSSTRATSCSCRPRRTATSPGCSSTCRR